VILEFSRRFLEWLDNVRLEYKTKTYHRFFFHFGSFW